MMNQKKLTVFCTFTALALCASVTLSAFTLFTQRQNTAVLRQMQGVVEDVDQEDDITVAGQYTVKSTLPISDAYQTGDTSALDDADKETLSMAKDILDEIITDGMSDFEKEKAVYDWLTSRLTSDTGILTVVPTRNDDSDNPHDVLKYRTAICVGYATTFRMMMQMLGIECKVVHSTDLTHTWDLVKLDDGWYHTDCYFDAGNSSYQNFNMDDARCAQGHDWTRDYFPAATGEKYNYIFSICEELGSIYDIPESLVQAVLDKKPLVSYTFKKPVDEKNEKTAQYIVERLTEQLNNGDNFTISYDWMKNDKDQYVLCFNIYYMNNSNSQVDDKTADKVEQILQKAMNHYYDEVAVG